MNEERPTHRVGVAQPTCTVIHEEYEWDLEHQHSATDDSLSFFPNIIGELAIHDFACVSSSTDAPIVDISQDTPYVSPSSNNEEDQSFIGNPLDISSSFSRNAEGDHPSSSSTPLSDSSNHEDFDQHPEFFDLGCRDLSISSSDHDVDSLIVNPSKLMVYEDPSVNEVETPQTVKELQLELMVMLGPVYPEVGFASD